MVSHFVAQQAHEGLLTSEFGEQVKQRYLVFARAVDAYSTRLYTEWEQRVGAIATEKLKQPILCALAACRGHFNSDEINEGGVNEPASTVGNPTKNSKVSIHQQATASVDSKTYGMPPLPYGVNFATELHMIIRESKYLDRMGFQASLNVTLSFQASLSLQKANTMNEKEAKKSRLRVHYGRQVNCILTTIPP